ncbi:MAG: ATPase domain-containing protein [Candidatus Micrarchaeota archaeon]
MERKFIKSCVPGLDMVLGGGLLENSIVTVSGPTGCGKSTLAAQFIHNGAVQENEPGLYISLEESRSDFLFHTSSYNWDFQSLEMDKKFILLDYPIHEVDQIVNQASAIQEIIATTGVKRVVIDSIMPIAMFFQGEDERKKGFLKFMENLRKWKATILIVSEDITVVETEHVPNTGYIIESFADGWINMFYKYNEERMERSRYLEVLKMKGVGHSTKSYPIAIDNDGLRVIVPENAKIAVEGLKKTSKTPPVKKPTKTPTKATEGSAKIAAVKKKLLRREIL